MAKSSKKSKETTTPESEPTAKPAKAKGRPKLAGKRARGAAGKTAPTRKPRATTEARKARPAAQAVISDDDIRIRAYFISEQRVQSGLAGDSAHDWLEARRQLQEEAENKA